MLQKGIFDKYLNIENAKSGYKALEWAIASNSDDNIITTLKAHGAQFGEVTAKKLYNSIDQETLFDILFDQANPKTLEEFCAYRPDGGSNPLEKALGPLNNISNIAIKIRSIGIKTEPDFIKLLSACSSDNKTLLQWRLEDANPEDIIGLIGHAKFFSSSKIMLIAINSDKLILGSTITTEQATYIAKVIEENQLLSPMTFADDVDPAVKVIIDSGCRLSLAAQDNVRGTIAEGLLMAAAQDQEIPLEHTQIEMRLADLILDFAVPSEHQAIMVEPTGLATGCFDWINEQS